MEVVQIIHKRMVKIMSPVIDVAKVACIVDLRLFFRVELTLKLQ